MLVQPVGEALVEVGADRLRQRLVGGVADQQVAEAEAVLAGELRSLGADQLAADERGERAVTCASPGASACTAPGGRSRPRPRRVRGRCRSGSSSWSSRAASSALSVGGTSTSPSARGHREHLRDEQRVAARRARILCPARTKRARRPAPRPALRRAAPAAAPRARPAPLHQLGSRHAHEQNRRAVPSNAVELDQIERRLYAPVHVVEDHHYRRRLLEQLPERPGDLVAARRDIRLAQE